MKYSRGIIPTPTLDPDTIMREHGTNRTLFNGQSGIYSYEGKYYLIGEELFLEYRDLAVAKEDWFGKSEKAMWEQIKEEGECIDSFVAGGKALYEDYFFNGLYYRVHNRLHTSVECSNKNWNTILPVEELEMMELPSLPQHLASFMFPVLMDEVTEIYFDEELCYHFLDRGEIRKTLFSSAEEGEIPQVTYIVEFDRAFFKANPSEYSIEGRYSSVDEVLSLTQYAFLGERAYEEVDYVAVCLLDRAANDEEIDYIADSGLYWWIKMNTHFEGNYVPASRDSDEESYDIYQLYNGFFVLDAYEQAVLGKYTSFESAYNGAKEEFGDEEYEEEEYEDEDE